MYFPLIYYILHFEEKKIAMKTLGRCEMDLRLKMFILWSQANV